MVKVSVSFAGEVESDLPSMRNTTLRNHTPVASATAGLFMFQMAALRAQAPSVPMEDCRGVQAWKTYMRTKISSEAKAQEMSGKI